MKIGYLTKTNDSCWWLRVLNPMSQLVDRGHDCIDQIFEKKIYCVECYENKNLKTSYTIHWDHASEVVCKECKQTIFSFAELNEWKEKVLSVISVSDIVAFQRPTEVSHLRLMKVAKAQKKTLVQLCDDNYLQIPEWNTGYQYYSERKGIIEETLRICDALDVTTEALKGLYAKYCSNIGVLKNSLDLEVLDHTPPVSKVSAFAGTGQRLTAEQIAEMRHGKQMIIWGGSPTHEKDLELIVGAARRLSRSENVVFGFIGYVHGAMVSVIPKNKIVLYESVPCVQYYALHKAIKSDIGLAPVVDVPFNHGKSALKANEYTAFKVFPVMSNLVTYQGAAPAGIYAENNEYSWYKSLREAIHMDPEKRLNALEVNRRHCEEQYDIKKNIHMWESFYGSL